jgi:hypothetical protein
MRDKVILNQNNKYESIIIVLVGIFFLMFFSLWKERIVVGLIYFFIVFGFLDRRLIWVFRKKEIIKRLPLFRSLILRINNITTIEYFSGFGFYVRNNVKLSFKERNEECSCFGLKEGEYTVLFNEIYDNADLKKLTWNKEMEEFEPFVKSKFGKFIKKE